MTCLHQYADDNVAVSDTTIAIGSFTACINDINTWMLASRLRHNPTKMQVMWFVLVN